MERRLIHAFSGNCGVAFHLLLNACEVGNCLGSVSLSQQRIAEQLMRGTEVRIQLQRVCQRRNRGAVIALLHARLPQETGGKSAIEFRHFAELSNGNVEVPFAFGLAASFEVLYGLG